MKITLSRFAVTAMTFAVFTLLATGIAHARGGIPPQCANTITSCGCTIGAPGNYQLANDLYASQGLTLKYGCIDIEGLHINLTVNHNIFGTGDLEGCAQESPTRQAPQPQSHSKLTGIGIHVLPTAGNVSISGIESSICGWNYGVESETNNINVVNILATENNVGVFFNNATDNSCLACGVDENGTGLQISGGSGNSVSGGGAAYNSQYGYWIDGSQHNMISGNGTGFNGLAGIYLGCSSTANVKPLIPCTIVTTTGNSIIGNDSFQNGKYGIANERQSFYNNFEGNVAEDSATKDFIDGNANCVYNNYQNDEYATKSPKCIQ